MERSCARCSDIQRLPEECLAHVISLTSPREACRLEAVSAAFRSAASSDQVWGRLLPSDCAEMVARAVDTVEVGSMKHLYFRLCDPILIDGGRMGFFVDRETGVKCFILPARELRIVWAEENTPQFWKWIHHPESRARGFRFPFQEVSVTIGAHVTRFPVRLMGEQESSRTILRWPGYNVWNFIRPANLPQEPLEDLLEPLNGQAVEAPNVPDEADELQHDGWPNPREQAQVQAQRDRGMFGIAQTRQDGWMEILLGEFYNEEGDHGDVTMSFSETSVGNPKSGLIVQGIEIRPKK